MRTDRERGAALIIVLSVLLMLFVIATPFLLSSKNDYRNALSSSERFRARAASDSALDWAKLELEKTHQGVEIRGQGHATPYWDAPGEVAVESRPASWASLIGEEEQPRFLRDPQGLIWGIDVRDEQSLLNVNSMPPFAWAGLIGRTTLAEKVEISSGEIVVASTEGFPAEGGEIFVNGELTSYQKTTDDRFIGTSLQTAHAEGGWVLPKLAFDLAAYNYRSPRAGQGGWINMGSPTTIKEVALSGGGTPIREERLNDLMRMLTAWGDRSNPAGWLAATRIERDVNPEDFNEKRGQPVRVRNPDYFNPGSVVRLAEGEQGEYGIVRSVRGNTVFLLEPVSRIYGFYISTLRSEMRHPVNINSASKEVLMMLLEGVEYSTRTGATRVENRVSAELADEVADVIIKNRPIRGISHLAELMKALYFYKRGKIGEYGGYAALDDVAWAPRLEDEPNVEKPRFLEVEPSAVETGRDPGKSAPFSASMALAIMQNAVNPSHRFLAQSTMPFSFTSGDHFSVETAASINDAAGSELAFHRQREIFKLAPARELAFRLNSQLDFERSITTSRTGRYVETHPRPLARYLSPRSKPEPRLYRYLANFDRGSRPSIYPDEETGDVRLQPARLESPIAGDFEEHFDGDLYGAVAAGLQTRPTGMRPEWIIPEGFQVGSRTYPLPLNGGPGSNGTVRGLSTYTFSNPNSGVVADADGLLPFVIDFWVKPGSFRNNPIFLSMSGDDPNSDRVEVWYSSSDRSIHAKVHDRTIDDASGFEEAAEVVWTPPGGQLEDDTWYHIAVHVGGTRPEQLSLHVDGFKRGESKFKSKLSGSMTADDMNFEVEDATGWPDHGVFWIGTELVQAERSGPNSYRVLDNQNTQPILGTDPMTGAPIYDVFAPSGRGARGTEARAHMAGEGVRLFGYTVAMTRPNGDAGIALDVGGGRLASPLAPFDICAIADDDTTAENIPVMGGMPGMPGGSISVRALDLNQTNRIVLDSFGQPGNLQQEHEAFQESGGYGLLVSLGTTGDVAPPPPLANPNQLFSNSTASMVQIFRYDRRQGTRLEGISPVSAALNLGLTGTIGNAKLWTSSLAPRVATRRASGGAGDFRMAAVIPISIHLTSVNGYADPGSTGIGGSSGGAGTQLFAEFAQLGAPNAIPTPGNFNSHDIEWIRYYAVDRQNQMFVNSGIDELTDTSAALLGGLISGGGGAGNPAAGNKPNLSTVSDNFRFRGQGVTRQFGYDIRDGAYRVHSTGGEVIPCFRVANADIFSPTTGYGDGVTLDDPDTGLRQRYYVSWSWMPQNSANAGPYALAAFTTNVSSTVLQKALGGTSASPGAAATGPVTNYRDVARILKFPSSELPKITPTGQAFVGSGAGGAVGGGATIDEINLKGLDGREFVLWDEDQVNPVGAGGGTSTTTFPLGIDDGATEIAIVNSYTLGIRRVASAANPVNINQRWFPDGREIQLNQNPGTILPAQGGLVQIDDEIIAYRGVSVNSAGIPILEDCERGFMGTVADSHSYGSNIVFLDWRAITRLQNGIQPDSYDIAVAGTRNFGPFGGAALVRNEIFHYTELAGATLRMPAQVRNDQDEGIFRGRFGTPRGSHGQDEFVLGMPFRYWDRFAEESDDPELAFYEFAVNEPRAFFKRLSWRHRFKKSRLMLKFLCRLDPTVPWNLPVEKSQGRLFWVESKSGQTQERWNHHRLMAPGKGMEVRAFFTWESGAFDSIGLTSNSWKETPELLEVDLRYLAAPQVLFRETLK